MPSLRLFYHANKDAFVRFNSGDAWAIASHIALSTLMALFPFLIVVASLSGFVGTQNLADEVAQLLLEAWPAEVAGPIAFEFRSVITHSRGDLLTLSLVLAIYFSSSGVESLRIALNRAYDVPETRSWWLTRLESVAYVLVGAIALLTMALLVVLAPLIFATVVRHLVWLAPLWPVINLVRLAAVAVILISALIIVHKWLPAGHRRFSEILPGIAVTMILWMVAGELFGSYLARFAYTYVTYYAGLASVMIALVFLYVTASIFIYGGELNAAIKRQLENKNIPADPA